MDLEQIKKILADRVVTYTHIVVDYRPHKKHKEWVRITTGVNLITYPDELMTWMANLTTSKLLWNSVLSTEDEKIAGLNIANFYLGTPLLVRYEYMNMPIEKFPSHIVQQYHMNKRAYDGYVYLKICKAIYVLPQAGILANKQLREKLLPHGYYKVAHIPGLWRHVTRSV